MASLLSQFVKNNTASAFSGPYLTLEAFYFPCSDPESAPGRNRTAIFYVYLPPLCSTRQKPVCPKYRFVQNYQKMLFRTFPVSDFNSDDGNRSRRGVLAIQMLCYNGHLTPGSHFLMSVKNLVLYGEKYPNFIWVDTGLSKIQYEAFQVPSASFEIKIQCSRGVLAITKWSQNRNSRSGSAR